MVRLDPSSPRSQTAGDEEAASLVDTTNNKKSVFINLARAGSSFFFQKHKTLVIAGFCLLLLVGKSIVHFV